MPRYQRPGETREEFRARDNAYMKDWRTRNYDREHAKSQEYNSRPEVRERKRAIGRKNRADNREEYNASMRDYNKTPHRRKYRREYARKKLATDMNFRLRGALRQRIYNALKKQNVIKPKKTVEMIGCDIPFLRGYLEAKFTPEMSWENYGTYWECDHITPLIRFQLTDPEQQKIAFHYTNLQPLKCSENRSKGAKIIPFPLQGAA